MSDLPAKKAKRCKNGAGKRAKRYNTRQYNSRTILEFAIQASKKLVKAEKIDASNGYASEGLFVVYESAPYKSYRGRLKCLYCTEHKKTPHGQDESCPFVDCECASCFCLRFMCSDMNQSNDNAQ
ncbi:hypothetical protein DdX_11461 [Ditylenchus destructor]|uniref:Uncharacterized protein n=1 Tax=Ditylenchus destructor TaxID=166010 RepID=A0AAD4MZ69_9BILA|nr:hypothetical protein DdX_11461 [Ditylenchus destructor]